jgi:hypothetical protein
MNEDHKTIALTRGRIRGRKVDKIVQLKTISEHKEAVMKVGNWVGEIPVFIPGYDGLTETRWREQGILITQQKFILLPFCGPTKEGAIPRGQTQISKEVEQTEAVKKDLPNQVPDDAGHFG